MPLQTPKTYGQIAYEANQEAWPPKELYVSWNNLTAPARAGWENIASAVIENFMRQMTQQKQN